MKLIEKHTTFKGEEVTFWNGYDKEKVAAHPTDGSEGLMIIFVSDGNEKLTEENLNTYVQYHKVPENFAQWGKILNKFKQKLNQKKSGNIGVKPI